ncbi:TonB-dependent receptor [Tenacibaculum dicentrarchi]|nr:TonB-dependent receptor [Tenacibaculum dicentrarchi]MCD8424627.1 TonB-dependent receptor [Tenacibaculum dicentrarchi]MCD8441932.1 TonB-dependent receptor [Tenacibaculum dicentrarchi]
MKKFTITILLLFLSLFDLNAQNSVKGILVHADTEIALSGVSIHIKKTAITSTTAVDGTFILNNLPKGNQLLSISLNGFETQTFPLQVSDNPINLGTIFLYEATTQYQDLSTIILTDDELSDDANTADNIAGLLQASKDVYLRTAAYEWSASFYSIKGLASENSKVLINGFEMNKLYNGRPQWSNWGGLNDVLRNQNFSSGLSPSNYTFGGVLGVTNMNTRASDYRKSARISYASSNRSYSHRFMAMYASGILKNGWAVTASASKRTASQGFINGTMYNANSFFISLEKIINENHSINTTAIYAKNSRGKSAANTQEVYDIKGIKYNPYWGYQNGKIRNARVKRIEEPILMLNHYWNMTNKTTLETGIAYQFGEMGNSRLDFNGGNDPNPTYYRKLPNYFLKDSYYGKDFENAYKSLVNFQNDGQLNWKNLYVGNEKTADNALFSLYEDCTDDTQLSLKTILNTQINENITLSGSLDYSTLSSENYARIVDLFGATGYVDINKFGNLGEDDYQNDLLHPNKIAKVGDKFKYHYEIAAKVYGGFTQLQFKYNKVDFFIAGTANTNSYQRKGLFKNGIYPGDITNPEIPNSLGYSEKLNFMGYGAKAGATYKISGRHLLNFNGGYTSKAPSIRNSFANSRSNNLTVASVSRLLNEKISTFDASYIVRMPFLKAKLTGYYTTIKDASNIAFYFTGSENLFVQEVLTGINKQHLGAELGIESPILSTFNLRAAANLGHYIYNNNPNITLASEISADSQKAGFDKRGIKNYGKASLKNYKIASGPQRSYSFGFDYRDPDYWFVGVTGNYLDKIYVAPSAIKRTTSFISDDTQLFPNYDADLAKKLLTQEQFDGYFTLNAVGGKTWRVGQNKYIGFFASVSNLLNKAYKTGGYEQGRTANYGLESADNANETPVFGTKYWYGRGASYFLNVNYRF